MVNYFFAGFFVVLLAGGFYGALVLGVGESLSESFISPRDSLAEASTTPDPSPTADAAATPTLVPTLVPVSTAAPPSPTAEAPQAAPNRGSCEEIRGTQYLSLEERSWYLSNCVASNRADCDQIRGTQYLSTAERNWYLINCV